MYAWSCSHVKMNHPLKSQHTSLFWVSKTLGSHGTLETTWCGLCIGYTIPNTGHARETIPRTNGPRFLSDHEIDSGHANHIAFSRQLDSQTKVKCDYQHCQNLLHVSRLD
jgi:hypothetical protein